VHLDGGGAVRRLHAGALLLKGKTVAVLESRLGPQLAALIEKRGARVMPAPALAEVPDIDPANIVRLIAGLQARPPGVAIFQTGVGTRALFDAADSTGAAQALLDLLSKCVVVARGPKPTGVLRSREVRIDRSAADPYTTAQVLAALGDVPMRDERVLVQRYGETNVELERALSARGAEVVEIPTYRWALPEDTRPLEALIAALGRGEVDAVVFTSASQARNLFELARRTGKDASLPANLNRTLVASIGPVCSAALASCGVNIAIEASPPKLGPLIDALEKALSS
jgi:uroporphyrinogen-III synthase